MITNKDMLGNNVSHLLFFGEILKVSLCPVFVPQTPAPLVEFFADPVLMSSSWEAGRRAWPRTGQRDTGR